jgi:hypothetical protein
LKFILEVGSLLKEGRIMDKSGKLVSIILLFTLLLFSSLVIEGQGYEYRKGYLKYKDSLGMVSFTRFVKPVNLSGQVTDVCSQLWLPADQFPPAANESLCLSRASNESTERFWYWNSPFSEYFEQDVNQLLEEQFPAISLLILPAELNQNISTPFFIHYEEDPRLISPFDPSVGGLAFQVSYLPWDIELVSRDPEPEDYEVLDQWENESDYLETALNSLWYIDSFSFSEVEVYSGDYPGGAFPLSGEMLVIILVLGGGIFAGLYLLQKSQKRVPEEFAPYFDTMGSQKNLPPPRVLEKKCVHCGEIIRFQSQFCLYCGSEQSKQNEG